MNKHVRVEYTIDGRLCRETSVQTGTRRDFWKRNALDDGCFMNVRLVAAEKAEMSASN